MATLCTDLQDLLKLKWLMYAYCMKDQKMIPKLGTKYKHITQFRRASDFTSVYTLYICFQEARLSKMLLWLKIQHYGPLWKQEVFSKQDNMQMSTLLVFH